MLSNEAEYIAFDRALAAWLNNQNVSPKIAIPVLALTIGNKIGEITERRDVEGFCAVTSTTQELILTTSLLKWINKPEDK